MTALSYHLGSIWGAVGNFVYPSNGPGSTGNGNTGWNPDNFFEFPSSVIRTWPTTNGLIVFTLSDIYVIQGTTISTCFSTPFLVGTGLGNYDGFTVKGAIPFFYTTDNQVLTLDPSSGMNEVGVAIGDQFGPNNGTGTFIPFYRPSNLEFLGFSGKGALCFRLLSELVEVSHYSGPRNRNNLVPNGHYSRRILRCPICRNCSWSS